MKIFGDLVKKAVREDFFTSPLPQMSDFLLLFRQHIIYYFIVVEK